MPCVCECQVTGEDESPRLCHKTAVRPKGVSNITGTMVEPKCLPAPNLFTISLHSLPSWVIPFSLSVNVQITSEPKPSSSVGHCPPELGVHIAARAQAPCLPPGHRLWPRIQSLCSFLWDVAHASISLSEKWDS